MKVKEFDEILARHVRQHVIPHIEDPVRGFLAGGMLGAGVISAETIRPELEAVGLLKGDEIAVDRLKGFVEGAFGVQPKIAKWGLIFGKEDGEALLRSFGVG